MRTLPTRAPQFFLLAALVVLGQGPANAQSPSCDSTEGSEACLPWGHHKLLEIGEIYDISRDGSVALGAHRPVYPDYKDAVVHYSNTAGYTEIQHVWSVQHVQIMWDRPQMSSDGRFVLGSARPPEVGGQTQDYRAIRWDTQTNTVDFLPTTTSSHATNVDPARVDGELWPNLPSSISGDGMSIAGLGLLRDSLGEDQTLDYPFLWRQGVGVSDAPQAPFLDFQFRAAEISGDGDHIAGDLIDYQLPSIGYTQAAIWSNATGITVPLSLTIDSTASAISFDGGRVAGYWYDDSTQQEGAYYWDVGGGSPIYIDNYFRPRTMTDDGAMIGGENRQPLFTETEPWIWTESDGGQRLFEYLEDHYGFPLYFGELPSTFYNSWLGLRTILSGDGYTIASTGTNWIVRVPPLQAAVLGDSFSSGEGVNDNDYEQGTDTSSNKCHRSPDAYARIIRPRTSQRTFSEFDENEPSTGQPGFTFDFVACSGALTKHVRSADDDGVPFTENNESSQIDQLQLSEQTDLLTITIGGNDAFFKEVATKCVMRKNCMTRDSVQPGRPWYLFLPDEMVNQVKGRVRTVYSDLRSRAPNATVIALGYPDLVSGKVCGQVGVARAFMLGSDHLVMDAAEQQFIRAMTDYFNELLKQAAAEAGIHFLNVKQDFANHAACDQQPWIHQVVVRDREHSLHPTAQGQAMYATVVNSYLLNEDGPAYDHGVHESGLPKNPTPTLP